MEPISVGYNGSPILTYPFNVKQSTAAARLPRNGSIFCWVLTEKKNAKNRVPAVNQTWLKRCDHGEFYTTEPFEDESIPFSTVFAGLNDSYDERFDKATRALHYTYTHISKDFDWYFKANDDTYTIMENLREFLSKYDPDAPFFFGYVYGDKILPKGLNSGEAGYVLSNAAMQIFAEELYNSSLLCPFHSNEDVGVARCLASRGIYPERTMNFNDEERFSLTSVEKAMNTLPLSDDLITLQWQSPVDLRMLEHLLYQVEGKSNSSTSS